MLHAMTIARTILSAGLLLTVAVARGEPFAIVTDGAARCTVLVDARGSTATESWRAAMARHRDRKPRLNNVYYYSLDTTATFLRDRLAQASGATLALAEAATGPAIVIGLAENHPDIAAAAGLDPAALRAEPLRSLDAFALHSTRERLYILGHTELGCRHGVAMLLQLLGFHFYNPSPRWWIIPEARDLSIDISRAWTPAFFNVAFGTNCGHHLNHGNGTETYLWQTQGFWFAMNFGSGGAFSPGHRLRLGSFNFRFIRDHQEALQGHDDWFALRADGQRDVDRPPLQRGLCVSNAALLAALVAHRVAELDHDRQGDRFIPTVTGEYGGRRETTYDCRCPACVALGDAEARHWRLINAMARGLAAQRPGAYLAVRANAAPASAVEDNVLIVLPALQRRPEWEGKAKQFGLSDGWRLYTPGAAEADPAWHRQRIDALRAADIVSHGITIPSAWGHMTPVLYLMMQMSFDPSVNEAALLEAYYERCFAGAAAPMRSLRAQMDRLDWREAKNLEAMLAQARQAYDAEPRADVRARVVDLMAYLHGLRLYVPVEAVTARGGPRDEAFYAALAPLMTYLCRHSFRHMMNPSDLAMGLCNRTALADGRPEFYWYRWEKFGEDPVWMDPSFPWRADDVVLMGDARVDAAFHDDEILALVQE